jgi:hypothetical protein
MSTNSQNINISAQNVQGKCDLKCSYNFDYPDSNTTASNTGTMIGLTYDNSSTQPVTYNNQKYTVYGISIVSPSIHTFNNTQAVGEIIIEHIPVTGGQKLYVGIPFKSSSESTEASNLITEIIQSVSNSAPSSGDTTNITITDFTLQKIIPNKPFYSYTSTVEPVDWIVFGSLEAIPLSSTTLSTLNQIIKPLVMTTPGIALYYNSSGPNTSKTVGQGIYISCKPTGSSKEETEVTYDKNTTTYNLGSLFDNSNSTISIIFGLFLGCIVFIIAFYLLNYLYNYLTADAPKLPSLKMPTMPKMPSMPKYSSNK